MLLVRQMTLLIIALWFTIAALRVSTRPRRSAATSRAVDGAVVSTPTLPTQHSDARYITFEPWNGGWNNRRMSLENAFVIALHQNRTLVLPPGSKTVVTYEQDYDVAAMRQYVPVLSWDDFLKVKPYLHKAENPGSREGLKPCSEHTRRLPKFYCPKMEWARDNAEVVVSKFLDGIVRCSGGDDADFAVFKKNKKEMALPGSYWVHFPMNLFGQFYQNFYFSKEDRVRVWAAVRDGVKIRTEWTTIAELAARQMGDFHAIHYRKGDFGSQFPSSIVKPEEAAGNVVQSTRPASRDAMAMYVATDEKSAAEKEVLLAKLSFRGVYTLQNFTSITTVVPPTSLGVIETLICSYSQRFTGTRLSTFTGYITRLRGHRSIHGPINPNVYYTDTIYTSEDEPNEWPQPYSWCSTKQTRTADLRGIRWTWGQEYPESWRLP